MNVFNAADQGGVMQRQLMGSMSIQGVWTLLSLFVLAGCGPIEVGRDPEAIQEVSDVQLMVLESSPLQLEIIASGKVSSAGWTAPKLVPVEYVVPPRDGIYDFTFYATPPKEPGATVITPIDVKHKINPLPADLKGVRILAQNNSIVAMLDTVKPQPVPEQIQEITKAQLTLEANTTDQWVIGAFGLVTSAGWSNPTLIPVEYIQPPTDGIYDYTFFATPPAVPGAAVLTPIEVRHRLGNVPADLKGVRIHSATNALVAVLSVPLPPKRPVVVGKVFDLKVSLLNSLPAKLVIDASGVVGSAGWTDAKLVPHQYAAPPQDGIYEFTFYATPPPQQAADIVLDINATYVVDPLPQDLLGVRVYAASNSMVALLPVEPTIPIATLIGELANVQLLTTSSSPTQLSINATGKVASAGWTNPELIPFKYIQAPLDGIYDYSFYATPPVDPSATVITPIETTYRLAAIPDNLKGVRVHSATNTIVVMYTPPVPVAVPAIIYSIVDVRITAATDVSSLYELYVSGMVESAGWTNPLLIPYNYLVPPQDGIYDFTFYATPPDGPAGGVFTSIDVRHRLTASPNEMKGVRIHASTNSMEVALPPGPTPSACDFVSGNRFQTAELREGGAAPPPIRPTGYYWNITFAADGTFDHRYSDVGGAGTYQCDSTGFHLFDRRGNPYVPGETPVDITKQSVTIPLYAGYDVVYYKVNSAVVTP